MHELGIANNIVEIVSVEASKHLAVGINRIVIELGALSGVEKDALEFCLPIAFEEQPMFQQTKVEIIAHPLEAKCADCQHIFLVEGFAYQCPECQSLSIQMLGGKEMVIKTVELDIPD